MHLEFFPLHTVSVVTGEENWILAVQPEENEAVNVRMKFPFAPPDHLSVKAY